MAKPPIYETSINVMKKVTDSVVLANPVNCHSAASRCRCSIGLRYCPV